jgi:hypothetical protein
MNTVEKKPKKLGEFMNEIPLAQREAVIQELMRDTVKEIALDSYKSMQDRGMEKSIQVLRSMPVIPQIVVDWDDEDDPSLVRTIWNVYGFTKITPFVAPATCVRAFAVIGEFLLNVLNKDPVSPKDGFALQWGLYDALIREVGNASI